MGRLHGLIVRKAADFESRVALAKTLWFQAIRNKMKHGHALWWERCGRPGTARAMQGGEVYTRDQFWCGRPGTARAMQGRWCRYRSSIGADDPELRGLCRSTCRTFDPVRGADDPELRGLCR